MDERALGERLAGRRMQRVRWVPETGSTNADLARVAADPAGGEQVLVADHQEAGRGRLDRTWVAPAGSNLLASFLLREPLDEGRIALVTPALALAAVEAVGGHGIEASVKWPNDVVVEDSPAPGKLAGILAEAVTVDGQVIGVVAGIGLNVGWPTARDDAAPGATSMQWASGSSNSREDILVAIIEGFERRLESIDTVVAEWRRRCSTLGKAVRVELADGAALIGDAVDLADDGQLIVQAGGTEHRVAAGDVVHLRRG